MSSSLRATLLLLAAATVACSADGPSPSPSAGPDNAPVVAVNAQGGLVLELVLDRRRVAIGDLTLATVRLTNRGPNTYVREGNTCGSGPAPVVVQTQSGFGEGRVWEGPAGEFKRQLLREAGVTEAGVVIGGFYDADMVRRNEGPGIPIACAAISMQEDFGPGASDEAILAWRALAPEGAVLEPGPAVVRATFSTIANGDRPEPAFSFSVEAPLEIAGDEPAGELRLAELADIALSNAEFAAWLAGKPRGQWVNTSFVTWPTPEGSYPSRPPFDRLNRRPVAEVGLFAEGGGAFYAAVIIDQATGEVLATRFE